MNEFQRWCDGLIDDETKKEQIERLVKLVLTPEQLESRERLRKVTNHPLQLELF